VEYGLSPDRVKVTGIPVHPDLARENRTPPAVRAELGWQPDLTTVLAVGSKRVGHLNGILRALNHSGLPLQLVAVAGGDDELYHKFQSTEWHVPTHVYKFIDNMPTLMHAADCIICKAGGLIVTESLACGLPLLLVDALPGQEAGNADYVIQGGAGELGQDPIEGLEIICHWLDRGGELLAQRAHNAKCLGRPRAADDIAELAWEAAARPSCRGRPQSVSRRRQPKKGEVISRRMGVFGQDSQRSKHDRFRHRSAAVGDSIGPAPRRNSLLDRMDLWDTRFQLSAAGPLPAGGISNWIYFNG
jgi:1,2-diacylglycerol 3-beta-galactosyltransferase